MRIVESKHIMNTKMARMMMGLVVGFLALAAGTAQAANYTNTLSGNWSDATRWPSSGAPASITDGNNVIVFNPTATDNSTNDNTGAFWLNQLLVAANQTVNLYAPGGNSLLFTNATGGALPALTNAGSSILTLNSAITLATNLSIGAAGAITINSNITDGALGFGFTKTGAGTLTLSAANTYSGATAVSNGTLKVGNASALANTATTVNGGGILDLNNRNIGNAVVTLNGGTLANTAGGGANGEITTLNLSADSTVDPSGSSYYWISPHNTTGTGAMYITGGSYGVYNSSGGTWANTGGVVLQSGGLNLYGASKITGGPITVNGGTFTTKAKCADVTFAPPA